MLIKDLACMAAGFLLAVILVPFVAKMAVKIGAVDKPNERKVHTKVMPRLGGLAIYISYILVVIITQPLTMQTIGLLVGSTVLVILGILDDTKDLPAKLKLLVQIFAAAIVIACGVRIEFMTNLFGENSIYLDALSLPITLIWIVGITNAVNLIDGLDGLAAGVAIIAAVAMAIVGWTYEQYLMASMAMILAGATLGFLKYNFHPAKIFMGDTGSLFLGFNLAVLATMGVAKSVTFISLIMPILFLGVPIFDTFFAILRRKMNNKPIFKADKGHLHHRLLHMGISHRNTVLIIYAISTILSASALLLSYLSNKQAVLLMALILTAILFGANRIGIIGRKESSTKENHQQQSIEK